MKRFQSSATEHPNAILYYNNKIEKLKRVVQMQAKSK